MRTNFSRIAHAMRAALAIASLAALDLGAQAVPQWRLVEEWRVGGEPDGPLSFDRVKDLDLTPDGRLVVLAGGDQRLTIFTARGAVVRSVGGKGSGPGEFADPTGIAVAPGGELIVADFANSRFAVHASNGDFLRTVPTPRAVASTQWFGFVATSGVLFDPVYGGRGADGPQEGWVRRRLDLTRRDSVTSIPCRAADPPPGAATIAIETSPPRGLVMRKPFATPVRPRVVDRDGYEWAPRVFGSNELVRRQLGACDPVAVARLGGTRAPVSAADRARSEESLRDYARAVQAAVPPSSAIPREFPWYTALHIDSANRLWVDRMTPERRLLNVFSPRGEAVAEVILNTPIDPSAPMVITADRMYTFVTDADNVQYLASFRIER